MGYFAPYDSQKPNSTMKASPRVIVVMTAADLQGLSVSKAVNEIY
jgi:hypothetical protein